MIKLLQSKKVKIPIIFLVEEEKDLVKLPLGVPFIKSDIKDYHKCVQMLEWEILWKAATESGISFDWEKILLDKGFTNLYNFGIAYSDGKTKYEADTLEGEAVDSYETIDSSKFLNDISYKVDIEVLKNLKLIPVWFKEIEEAISENITNTIVYNPSLYTKKLDLPLGSFEFSPAKKSLIIIDISSSIPVSISSTLLILAKTLSEQFYADLIITGSKSTLYEYKEVSKLNIKTIYSKNGTDNDQVWFKKLVSEPKNYETAIVFGDNHHPGQAWANSFNKKTRGISVEKGKEICKWNIKKIISLHVTKDKETAGYATWFNTTDIKHIDNWVHYFK